MDPEQDGCWCDHSKDRHWSGATNMTFPDGCHDCPGWDGAHTYGQELPWLPEGEQLPAAPLCPHCQGTGGDPEDEGDWIPEVHQHNPYSAGPCPQCNGRGTVTKQRPCGDAQRHPSHTFLRMEVLFQCPGLDGTEPGTES